MKENASQTATAAAAVETGWHHHPAVLKTLRVEEMATAEPCAARFP